MPHYFCAVHVDPAVVEAMSVDERAAFDKENTAFAQWLAEGRSVVHASLQPPETATLVRERNGKVSMTDGPFVETKEHLAGFILLHAETREAALEILRSGPTMRIGTIEVREANM